MWDQVGQALRLSMTKMLSQLAGLLPGIVALVTALLVAVLITVTVFALLSVTYILLPSGVMAILCADVPTGISAITLPVVVSMTCTLL